MFVQDMHCVSCRDICVRPLRPQLGATKTLQSGWQPEAREYLEHEGSQNLQLPCHIHTPKEIGRHSCVSEVHGETPSTPTDTHCPFVPRHHANSDQTGGFQCSAESQGSLQPHRGSVGHIRTVAMLAHRRAAGGSLHGHFKSSDVPDSRCATPGSQVPALGCGAACHQEAPQDVLGEAATHPHPQTSSAVLSSVQGHHACSFSRAGTCGEQFAAGVRADVTGRLSSEGRLASCGPAGMAGGAGGALRRRGQNGILQDMLHLRARLVGTLRKIDSIAGVLTDESLLATIHQ